MPDTIQAGRSPAAFTSPRPPGLADGGASTAVAGTGAGGRGGGGGSRPGPPGEAAAGRLPPRNLSRNPIAHGFSRSTTRCAASRTTVFDVVNFAGYTFGGCCSLRLHGPPRAPNHRPMPAEMRTLVIIDRSWAESGFP